MKHNSVKLPPLKKWEGDFRVVASDKDAAYLEKGGRRYRHPSVPPAAYRHGEPAIIIDGREFCVRGIAVGNGVFA